MKSSAPKTWLREGGVADLERVDLDQAEVLRLVADAGARHRALDLDAQRLGGRVLEDVVAAGVEDEQHRPVAVDRDIGVDVVVAQLEREAGLRGAGRQREAIRGCYCTRSIFHIATATGERMSVLRNEYLKSSYLEGEKQEIIECNSSCGCGQDCWNRVVQKGRTLPLEIFMTPKCGFGESHQVLFLSISLIRNQACALLGTL